MEKINNIGEYKYKEKISEDHLQYLKDRFEFEERRQDTIENKLNSMIGQSALVVTIIGLFIPLFIDKLSDVGVCLKIILIASFLSTIAILISSAFKAVNTLIVNRYNYMTYNISTVLNKFEKTSELFEMQIKDLYKIIDTNTGINNKKADELISSSKLFRTGIIFSGVFGFFIALFIFYPFKKEPQNVVIKNPVTITEKKGKTSETKINYATKEYIDSILTIQVGLYDSINRKMDTLNTKISK